MPRVETILLMRCAPHTFTSHPQNNLSIEHWLTHLYLCTNVDAQTYSDMSDAHLYIDAYAYALRGIGMYTSTRTHVWIARHTHGEFRIHQPWYFILIMEFIFVCVQHCKRRRFKRVCSCQSRDCAHKSEKTKLHFLKNCKISNLKISDFYRSEWTGRKTYQILELGRS